MHFCSGKGSETHLLIRLEAEHVFKYFPFLPLPCLLGSFVPIGPYISMPEPLDFLLTLKADKRRREMFFDGKCYILGLKQILEFPANKLRHTRKI